MLDPNEEKMNDLKEKTADGHKRLEDLESRLHYKAEEMHWMVDRFEIVIVTNELRDAKQQQCGDEADIFERVMWEADTLAVQRALQHN